MLYFEKGSLSWKSKFIDVFNKGKLVKLNRNYELGISNNDGSAYMHRHPVEIVKRAKTPKVKHNSDRPLWTLWLTTNMTI